MSSPDSMKRIFSIFTLATMACTAVAQSESTVIVNPATDSSTAVRLSWHTASDSKPSACIYTRRSDKTWKKAKTIAASSEIVTAFDSLSSKNAAGADIVERIKFYHNTTQINGLKPNTEYMYKFGNTPDAEVRYFKTAPRNGGSWTAAIISDFHSYSPLPLRTKAAMDMLDRLEAVNKAPFDMVLHVGDVCAWGGSYSFWKDLYSQNAFKKYLWAGVNGNHDNMDRRSTRLSNDYFRYTNNNPHNGYGNQQGVCYAFRYGQVLFVMLNSEAMRSEQGLLEAQQWVRQTIKDNPSKYIVVMEHYQWFNGDNGATSQYARWNGLFDECGVDLAIAANNHIYARTNAIYNDAETDGTKGTVYIQTPSSDNERGQATQDWTENKDKIKFIWSEGPKTVGAVLMNVDNKDITLSLHDRYGKLLDTVRVKAKR